MPSDSPYQKGDRVLVWHKDESKKKSEGCIGQRNCCVAGRFFGLVEVHRAVRRVNQSKVRRDGDPWHDVAIPLKSDDSRSSEPSEVRDDGTRSSSHDEALERLGQKVLDRAISGYCYEHETCYHSLTSGKSDFVEISPHLTGLTACTVHSGLAASEPVEFGEWTAKKIQSSIESAWQVILAAESNHIIIHPVIPTQWPQKAQRAFWHFCAEVRRWQNDRGHFVPIMYPALSQIAVERQTEGSPEACPWSYSTASNTRLLKEELAVPPNSSMIANTTHTKLHPQNLQRCLQTDKPVFDQNDYHLQDKWSTTPRTSDQTSFLNHSLRRAILDDSVILQEGY